MDSASPRKHMRCVVVASPYAGDIATNLRYARACVRDCMRRDEAPLLPHLLYTHPEITNDRDPVQRQRGLDMGMAWARRADVLAVYTDRGISPGMSDEIDNAKHNGVPVEYRTVPGWIDEPLDAAAASTLQRHIQELLEHAQMPASLTATIVAAVRMREERFERLAHAAHGVVFASPANTDAVHAQLSFALNDLDMLDPNFFRLPKGAVV